MIATVGISIASNPAVSGAMRAIKRGPRVAQLDVFHRGHIPCALDAAAHARIIVAAAPCDQVAVPGIGLDRREPAGHVDFRDLVEFGKHPDR